MMLRIPFLFIFCLSVQLVLGQEDAPIRLTGYERNYIGIESGLSNNAVTAIYQDKKGFVWIGTYDGLNRYDGYDFLVFRNQPRDSSSLVHNRIVSIYGHRNEVWVGTKRGLSVYDYHTGKFQARYYLDPKTKRRHKLTANINDITGRHGKIVVATAGQGVMVRTDGGPLSRVPLWDAGERHYDYHAQGTVVDKDQNIWTFIQGYGLAVRKKEDYCFKVVLKDIKSANCIELDSEGDIWIGSDYGLARFHVQKKDWYLYPAQITKNKITDIMNVADDGQIWVATDGNGLLVLEKGSKKSYYLKEGTVASDLVSNAVYGLALDRQGRKWVGTLRGGINILEKKQNRFITIDNPDNQENGLPSDFILSFCETSRDSLWVGTDGGGVSIWDRKRDRFTNYRHHSGKPGSLPNDFVTAIVEGENNLWLATYGGGVCRYDSGADTFVPYTLSNPEGMAHWYIWVLFKDWSGDLWAATSNGEGLYRYNSRKDRFDFVDVGIYGIISMAQDHNGNYWVGTFDHLVKLDLSKEQDHEVIDIGYPVRDILSLGPEDLLVATEGSGVWRLDRERGTVKTYLQEEGLPNNSVLKLVGDGHGKVWMSTYRGLAKFDPIGEKFTSFFASDGLQSNQFNYNAGTRLYDGKLVFGGIKGFNLIDPLHQEWERSFPSIHLTQLRVNNQPGHPDGNTIFSLDKLELPYDQSMVSLDFLALEYAHPEKIEYAYHMEGWDEKWHFVKNSRMANYSKLREGEYTFHVRATNAQGEWSPQVVSLPIVILPPWYRTWWAYGLYIVIVGGLAGILVLYQRKQDKLKYQVSLSREMAHREKELNEKKMNFFTNISHEFRSPLTMIINPLREVMYGERKQLEAGAVEVVYRNSKRLLSLVDQLLLFRKVQTEVGNVKMVKLDAIGLCKEVFTCFIHHAKGLDISYQFHADLDSFELIADRQKLEIAVFNLVSNALKFVSPHTGKVLVSAIQASNRFMVTVEDNGKGIGEQDRERIFDLFYQGNSQSGAKGFGIGLYLVKKLVEEHKGSIDLTYSKWGGAKFTIGLPTGKSHVPDGLVHEDVGEQMVFLEELLDFENNHMPQKTETGDGLVTITDGVVTAKKRVLAVDDNPQLRQYIKKIFETQFQVVLAESAEQALEIVEGQEIDLIISDVVMKGMNGVELCKELKSREEYRYIPMVLLTASASDSVKLKGIEVGADDYITKPFDKNYLMARVKGILRQQESVQRHLLTSVSKKPTDRKLSKEDKEFIDKMVKVIEENLDNEEFSIQVLAVDMCMSHSMLYRKVKLATGKTVNEIIRFVRLRAIATTLITTDAQVNEAVSSAGWHDLKYFRKQFSQQYGMTPSAFQKKYKGAVTERQYILNAGFLKL
ncbi:hybrid sensor histidine kinase/response regulator transcription factor [Echinicola rosea]|uniref:hybrid sensor histidine kinase/response regulator transcription factor n=1 Tax=Echinicola rosea TaxID=1807691 RepID=UPI0010CA6E38|nr:two-component regulator propeller domain-containing protein [Echinicola rosea]